LKLSRCEPVRSNRGAKGAARLADALSLRLGGFSVGFPIAGGKVVAAGEGGGGSPARLAVLVTDTGFCVASTQRMTPAATITVACSINWL
jgi:hypothetical protein